MSTRWPAATSPTSRIPLRGHRRYNAIMALRSLFRFAKRHDLTFADPTRHLSGSGAPTAPCRR